MRGSASEFDFVGGDDLLERLPEAMESARVGGGGEGGLRDEGRVRFAGRTVDLTTGIVEGAGIPPTRLTTREQLLLRFLLSREGEPVGAEEIDRGVWGYVPDGPGHALYSTVHRLRRKLEPDPRFPRYILTVHGDGYRIRTDGDGDADLGSVTEPIPVRRDSFHGRTGALETMRTALYAPGSAVWIAGPPGVGKTRLAVEFARKTREERWWPGGVAISDFGGFSSGRKLLDRLDRLSDSLHPARLGGAPRILLILDDLWPDPEAVALLAGVGTRLPHVSLVVTSRMRIRLPGGVGLLLEPLDPSAAARLLSDRLAGWGRAGGGGGLGMAEWSSLLNRVDHWPFAIECLAARGAWARELDRGGDLTLGRALLRVGLGRGRFGQSFHARFEASWQRLSPEARTTLEAVAEVGGEFTAATLVERGSVSPAGVRSHLAELWRHSWISAVPDRGRGGELRYRVSVMAASFARSRTADGAPATQGLRSIA